MSDATSLPWYVKRPAWPIGIIMLVLLVSCIIWVLKRPVMPDTGNLVKTKEDMLELRDIQKHRNAGLSASIDQATKSLDQQYCPVEKVQESPTNHADAPNTETNGSTPLKASALRKKLANAVVYIVAKKGSTGGTGSGFFIDKNLVMTNAHVVDGRPDNIMVYSQAAKKMEPAIVVASDYGRTAGSRDYAILRVDMIDAPDILSLSSNPQPIMKVYASGYPGVYMNTLDNLNPGSLPDMITTSGFINAIKVTSYNVPAITHEARIYKGNSGGPLVNQCGSAVGINTFYIAPGSESAKIDFALGSHDIHRFLKSHNVQVGISNALCE